MIAKVSKRVAEKYWSGMVRHPFLEALDKLLVAEGFQFDSHDVDATCSSWVREVFQDHQVELSIWPETTANENFGVTVTLAVISKTQRWLESEIGISGCRNSEENFSHSTAPVALLSLSLNWLLSAWAPRTGSFASSFGRWKMRNLCEAADVAEDVVRAFRRHGSELMSLFDSPGKLGNLLSSLENFPGAAGGVGPVSASPNEYAAVLYALAGLRNEAIAQLDVWEAQAAAGGSESLSETTCCLSKYRNWLLRLQ